jgi:glycosyltransferase involved in cell wall biosynthesis
MGAPGRTSGISDAPPVEGQPGETLARQGAMSGPNPYRKIALDLQQKVDAMHHSRTWQLVLACGLARRSFREALRLPQRIWRIVSGPPPWPAEPSPAATAVAGRKSRIVGWPADQPLVSVAVCCERASHGDVESTVASLLASSLQDFEILLLGPGGAGVEAGGALPATDCLRAVAISEPDSSAGRNEAVRMARGKYVVLLHAGDRPDATFLEKACRALEEDPRLGFAYSQNNANPATNPVEAFSLDRALRYNHVPDSAVFRREAWSEAGGFRADTALDLWDFWVALGTLGWSGLLIREELVTTGAGSWTVQQRARRAESEGSEEIRRRHAALLQAPPRAAPGSDSFEAQAAPGVSNPTLSFSQRRFLSFADRPAILCIVPWLDIGGAEQVVLQIIRGLSDRFSFAVAATLPADHNRAAEFREATPWVYHLPESSADAGHFLADLATIHGIQGVLVSSSEAGYDALAALKQRGLWTADIVHNTAPEGHLDRAIGSDGALDFHFACGRAQADALRTAAAVPASRMRTVWTAVDAAGRFDPQRYESRRNALRAEFGLDSRDVVLAYVGRFSIEKDVPLFVAAASEIIRRNPGLRVRALIAGDGPELLRVERAIEREEVWNEVRLLGDSRRVPEILAASDYMLLTSKTEGSPLTLLEAMSLGRIVMTTAVGNVREVVDHGVNGFVVEGREPAAFAACFEEIRRDPEREKGMRQAARRTILERFEESRMLAAYAEVFGAALGSGEPNRSV